MTEAPSPVFFAQAKPEHITPPKPEQSKTVSGVRKAVDKWLERIGPKGVENHFVKAHENVLATLSTDQRKEVFAQEAEKWQKAGRRWGIAATIIDGSLAGLGIGLTVLGLRNPRMALAQAGALPGLLIPRDRQNNYRVWLANTLGKIVPHVDPSNNEIFREANKNALKKSGKFVAITPAIASLGILIGSGPGHWLAHLAAGGMEQIGKMKARTNNYVDSGKAAEHANKVSNALGKAATETAKWAAEHPEEIRKTVETVNRVKRENSESTQKLKEAQQKAVEAKLEADYKDWIAHHPDKVYYEQSGQPIPSKADYIAMKEREAAAKQAAREEEKRGEAKR